MKRNRFAESQILAAIKQYEGGRDAVDVSREYGINKATLYNWRKKYSGTAGIVQLFTENGVLLKQTVISSNNTSIELKGLSAATYFIRVIDETGKKVLFTSPVVKHH
jgi:transposase-like protein